MGARRVGRSEWLTNCRAAGIFMTSQPPLVFNRGWSKKMDINIKYMDSNYEAESVCSFIRSEKLLPVTAEKQDFVIANFNKNNRVRLTSFIYLFIFVQSHLARHTT